jgi:GAF domain-containing protein
MAEVDSPRRLAALDPAILSLDRDTVLEDCVDSAARAAAAPMAMLSFVMRHVQLFRAARGLAPSVATTRATARSVSLCQFVVKYAEPLLVADACNDPRFSALNPRAYGVVAYAGVPVWLHGELVASLCVADRVPRQWPASLVGELDALAQLAARRLETLVALSETADDLTPVPLSQNCV